MSRPESSDVSAKVFGIAAFFALGITAAGAEPVVVGGLTPSVRPAAAPSIQGVHYGPEWYRRGLTGVSQPYPQSLYFMDRQGEWYTPFTRAGMLKPYDIRNWHK